jgi:hypothetical protein
VEKKMLGLESEGSSARFHVSMLANAAAEGNLVLGGSTKKPLTSRVSKMILSLPFFFFTKKMPKRLSPPQRQEIIPLWSSRLTKSA